MDSSEHLWLLAVWLTVFAMFVQATVKFPKDHSTDVEFPPKLDYRPHQSIVPMGHLRPFGFQRKSKGRVKEYGQPLAPYHFWEDHVRGRVPLVYRNAVTNSSAMTNWSDDNLRKNYGDLDVLVELKKEDRTKRSKRMKLAKFLSGYMTEDWYVVTVLPDEMRKDIQVPRSLLCGTFRRYIQETNLWISSGGTTSVIHYDADHNIHCLLDGLKNFFMIHPKYARYLEMAEKSGYVGSGYSSLDVDMINMFKYPDVAKVQWTWASIRPGDCIYIPAGYLHQVRAHGRSISATMLFTTQPSFDRSDCTEELIDRHTTLDEVRVLWTYKKGDKVIEMGYMNPESIRESFLMLLGEDNHLTFQEFNRFFVDVITEDKDEPLPRKMDYPESAEAFRIFDTEGKGYLTREELMEMDVELFKDFARLLDLPSGPTADEIRDETRDEL